MYCVVLLYGHFCCCCCCYFHSSCMSSFRLWWHVSWASSCVWDQTLTTTGLYGTLPLALWRRVAKPLAPRPTTSSLASPRLLLRWLFFPPHYVHFKRAIFVRFKSGIYFLLVLPQNVLIDSMSTHGRPQLDVCFPSRNTLDNYFIPKTNIVTAPIVTHARTQVVQITEYCTNKIQVRHWNSYM